MEVLVTEASVMEVLVTEASVMEVLVTEVLVMEVLVAAIYPSNVPRMSARIAASGRAYKTSNDSA
jgi:hypothetical protein